MTKVPERKLSYGEILNKQRKYLKASKRSDKNLGTKNFATYEYQEPRKNSKSRNGAMKITKRPKQPIPEIYRKEYGRDMRHLKSIMNEDL